jgi:ribonuclease E
MLINAKRNEHLRVAIIEGTTLKDYHIEIADRGLTRGNIYRGVVANVQPALGAAFIDIDEERHGFLPVADVLASAYHNQPPAKTRRPTVDQVLERRKPILVQVTKDGVGQKGAALHTNLAIAGRYLVLTPYDSSRGISRKAEDDKTRKTIRDRLGKLSLPDGHGVIVRTNGIEQNMTTLNRDLSALLRLWKRIRDEANKGKGPRLLYSDQDLVVQALRDYLDPSIAEVLVDSDEVYEKAAAYMEAFMPRSKTNLVRYQDRLPLFSRYRLEGQIDQIYERSTPLPSGGSLVIDNTEALTAVDVNSGRATRAENHDETILNVNVEAAKEAARQLRLRDIGGLVVIDFIDMRYSKHQRKLEKVMRDAMKEDKARYTVGKISPNGLLEINRQRIRQALRLRTHQPCPSCEGVGTVATPEFAALNVLRRLEGKAVTGLYEGVTVALNPQVADALQNRHRQRLAELEAELDFTVEILSASGFTRAEDRFEWKERETVPEAVERKLSPALTATDLTLPGGRRKPVRTAAEDEEETREAAPKKRRRRRRKPAAKAKSAASPAAEGKAAERKTAASKAEQGKAAERKTAASKAEQGKAAQREAVDHGTDEQKADAGTGDGKPSRPRRRRRTRRRTRPEEPKPNASAAAEAASGDGDELLASDPLFDEPEDQAEDSGKPSRPRRRRRTRRRASAEERQVASSDGASSADASSDDSSSAGASSEGASSDDFLFDASDASEGVDAGDDSAPPSRPRRRRRTRRSAATPSAPPAGAPAAEPSEAGRPEAAHPDNGDEPRSDAPPAEVESKSSIWNRPSRALRWQWWGGPEKGEGSEPGGKPPGSGEPSSSESDG